MAQDPLSHVASWLTSGRPLTDDAAFLAAEQNLAELSRQIGEADEKVTSLEEEKALVGPLNGKRWALWDIILASPPVSVASAIIKLRLLTDPLTGIEVGAADQEVVALRQVLAFLEAQAGT